LWVSSFEALFSNIDGCVCQAAAEAMPEQERLANEEAEKRLKAALTAKKPLTGSSRVASPAIGGGADTPTDSKAVVQDTTSKEDVPMETEPPVPTPEVMSLCARTLLNSYPSQSPWLPELVPLFEDVKKIAPPNAYNIIGYAHLVVLSLSIYLLVQARFLCVILAIVDL
jgi:THO complex subunit 2